MEFSQLFFNVYECCILTITAVSAFVIYRIKSVGDVKAAASAVRLQIKDIERKISHIKKFCIGPDFTINELEMFNSTLVYDINQWEVYHHKLFRHLSTDEYELVSSFYEEASAMKRVQIEVKQFFLFSMQNRVINFYNATFSVVPKDNNIESCQNDVDNIHSKFNSINVPLYIPKYYGMYLSKHLDEYTPLVGTTAFQKLETLANKKFLF